MHSVLNLINSLTWQATANMPICVPCNYGYKLKHVTSLTGWPECIIQDGAQ